jgi:hypothetical protein
VIRRGLLLLAGLGAIAVLVLFALSRGAEAPDRSAGTIQGAGRAVPTDPGGEHILFGDLHVHTTFSIDAFIFSLPLFGGEGAHPPADACDFARYCAEVDFFSINDHAEGLTPARWEATKDSIRECNARAGDPANPDLVAFMGYEWTQAGPTPDTHYGHRNVMFPGLDDDELPSRPITSLPDGTMQRAPPDLVVQGAELLRPLGFGPYADFFWWIGQMTEVPDCPAGVDSKALPADCRENASTPAELFEKLAQWDLPTLVIPHGLAWGIHAPPGSRFDNSLAQSDPGMERLLEVFSGHGNSEEYRAEAMRQGPVCPAPTADFLPCCWQAGELVRERCGELSSAACEVRVVEARRLALEAGTSPERVLPDTQPEDWLDCDQCRDCFKPAMSLRPGESAQYAVAAGARFGFIASSDNHSARAGVGYKQYARKAMTDARGFASSTTDALLSPWISGRQAETARAQPAPPATERGLRPLLDVEREASFMYPGGLVAVHATGRDRGSIWDALVRREVYGTSGPRILLWFDLVNAPGGPAPMGSETVQGEPPRFEVRALGSPVQLPGCPDRSLHGLPSERLARLCRGECRHPGESRHAIVEIEVVRVLPRADASEDVASLIEDPWRRFACEPDPAGCMVQFEDPDWAEAGRGAAYYVRALQAPTPAVNGANLRTGFDAAGRAVAVSPCHGDYRTEADDDCLAPVQERAWSSPIYVDAPD